jgi:hypothetical protein
MQPRKNSPKPVYGGRGLEEAAAGKVALGVGLPGGDVERVLQCLDVGGLRHPLGAGGLPRLEGLDGAQRGVTVCLLLRLLRCGRLRCLGQRICQLARLLRLVLDEVLRADDVPLLGLVVT